LERTFSIIKPDAVKGKKAGKILDRIEQAGFTLVGLRQRHLTKAQAEGFYHVHQARPFFGSLVEFMTSGPCITMVLEKDGAIASLRELMGATDPAKAAAGTIRKDFAESIEANAIHGSDGPETAAFEIGFFFAGLDL
jgi:nucleoside-diphosphate kinase